MSASIHDLLSRPPALSRPGCVCFSTGFDEHLQMLLSSVSRETAKLLGGSVEGYHACQDQKLRKNLLSLWEERSAENFPWLEETWEIFTRIAEEDALVLDLASGTSMGMLPLLLSRHPHVSVCVSDIDDHSMTTLSDCLQSQLPAYRICAAAFDNNNIPIRDNALSYITGIDAICSSVNPAETSTAPASSCSLYRTKAISEVYRILKPGGCFLAAEHTISCDLDLPMLYENIHDTGLYGFSVAELLPILQWLTQESWHDTFTSAGFTIETEKEYLHRLTGIRLSRFLHEYARRPVKPPIPATPETIPGLEIYKGCSFFILRKPET